ncbi:MAG: hypothetical protein ABSB40_05340 [Nitrososphaeria archaeon]
MLNLRNLSASAGGSEIKKWLAFSIRQSGACQNQCILEYYHISGQVYSAIRLSR